MGYLGLAVGLAVAAVLLRMAFDLIAAKFEPRTEMRYNRRARRIEIVTRQRLVR